MAWSTAGAHGPCVCGRGERQLAGLAGAVIGTERLHEAQGTMHVPILHAAACQAAACAVA